MLFLRTKAILGATFGEILFSGWAGVLSLLPAQATAAVFEKPSAHTPSPALTSLGTAVPTARSIVASERKALSRLLVIENERDADSAFLIKALESPSARVARQAALVLGRIGNAKFAPVLIRGLGHTDASVRRTVAFSLGLVGGDKVSEALIARLEGEAGAEGTREADARVRQALWQSLGRLCSREDLARFVAALAGTQAETAERALAGAAEGLGNLWVRERKDWGAQPEAFAALVDVAHKGGLAAEAAAVTLGRFRGDRAAEQIKPLAELFSSAQNETVRTFSVRALGSVVDAATVTALWSLLASSDSGSLRVEVALALGKQSWTKETHDLALELLTSQDARVTVQTLQTLVTLAPQIEDRSDLLAAVKALLYTESRSAQERKNALLSLTALDGSRARELALPWVERAESASDAGLSSFTVSEKALALASLEVFARTAETAGEDQGHETAERLAALMLSSDGSLAGAASEALALLSAETLGSVSSLPASLAQALRSADFRVTCNVSSLISTLKPVSLAGDVLLAWENFRAPEQTDGRLCLLDAMAALAPLQGAPRDALLARIASALGDSVAQISQRAGEVYKTLTSEDPKSPLTVYTRSQFPTPSLAEVQSALASELVVTTTRGSFRMKMLSAAPLTVVNFVRLARRGFYDGLDFHRVVPDFVVQGGDPRGDGWGGPGYLIRDEVSLVSHAPGTVGVATSGKDTGGSQFFVNETHNFHLNGTYTVFARVSRGMDVVRRLTEGDLILSVKVEN